MNLPHMVTEKSHTLYFKIKNIHCCTDKPKKLIKKKKTQKLESSKEIEYFSEKLFSKLNQNINSEKSRKI